MARIALNVQTIGFDANEKPCIIAHFICDSQADLPTINEYTDNTLLIGCTAHCIEEQTDHELKSEGVWLKTATPPNAAEIAALSDLIDNGAKNRWKITIPTLPTGFTATIDSDGGLILNGTTGSNALTFATSTQFHAGETVVLSGCPVGGSDDSYRLDILRGVNTNYCYGEPVIATGFTENAYPVRIRIAANYTCDNLKFFPMVCSKAAWDISKSFRPYTPTNRELYEMILALQ